MRSMEAHIAQNAPVRPVPELHIQKQQNQSATPTAMNIKHGERGTLKAATGMRKSSITTRPFSVDMINNVTTMKYYHRMQWPVCKGDMPTQ